jgi:hypothetical protein
MEFEGIRAVTVGSFLFKIFWQVDNHDGLKRTFLDADTATDAEIFRNPCNFGGGCYLDTEFANFNDRATLFAFLTAFFGFAPAGDGE